MRRSRAAALSTGTGLFSSAAVRRRIASASSGTSLARSRSDGTRSTEHVEAEEQVLAEGAGRHHRAQVAVGGGDHPHVDLHRHGAAQPVERLLLQRPQHLGLERQRQLADLVEEQRAAVRDLEAARPPRDRAGERAAFVAEQLALEQRAGDRRAVHRHERPVAPLAQRMQRAREQLLAGAALAGEEHGGVGGGGAAQRGQRAPDRLVLADDLGHAAAAPQLFLEEQVLGGQAPLGEGAADDQAEVVGIDRLGEEVERALAHRPHDVGDRAVGGQQDDGHLRVAGLGGPQHAEPVAARQLQIGEDQRRTVALQHLDGVRLVRRLEDAMTGDLEREPQHLPQRIAVFDQQDLATNGRPRGLRHSILHNERRPGRRTRRCRASMS